MYYGGMYIAIIQYANKLNERSFFRRIASTESEAFSFIQDCKKRISELDLHWTYSTVMELDTYMESEIDSDLEEVN